MNNLDDFVIENGLLKGYKGPLSGDITIPEEVTGCEGAPHFMDIMEGGFSLTLSSKMTCSVGDLLSREIEVLNIPAGATVTMKTDKFNSNNGDSFFKKLKEINVAAEHEEYSSRDGMLFNKDQSELICCPRAISGTVVLPDTVTDIAEKAFYGCALITEVVIPAGVTEIKERTFADCKALKKVVLPDGVTKIGNEAFLRCSKLTSAGLKGTGGKKGYAYEFPWDEVIPENAFNGMKNLKTVVLPETIKVIGKNAFKACSSLESINLPENVKCDKKAFKDCKKLSV